MTRRLIALGLLLAAAVVHVGLTVPARRARDEARAAFARKREERERVRGDVARLERRAHAARPQAPEGDAAAVRALRRSLLRATRGLPIGDVQIAAQPERRGGVAARGRLAAEGTQADLLRAAGRLAEPASGVVLERVQLLGRLGKLRLDAETISLRAGS